MDRLKLAHKLESLVKEILKILWNQDIKDLNVYEILSLFALSLKCVLVRMLLECEVEKDVGLQVLDKVFEQAKEEFLEG